MLLGVYVPVTVPSTTNDQMGWISKVFEATVAYTVTDVPAQYRNMSVNLN